jgi:hypothetical protein
VFKHGVSTGHTSGIVKYIDSTSFYVVSDCYGPFASFGDSGAVVSDVTGRAYGIILCGRNDFDPRNDWVIVLKYECFRDKIDSLEEDEDEE